MQCRFVLYLYIGFNCYVYKTTNVIFSGKAVTVDILLKE